MRYSDWDATLECHRRDEQPVLRLGLREIRGFNEAAARRIEQTRALGSFHDVVDLCERAGLDARERKALADAGALKGLAGHRHRARWAAAGVEQTLPLFAGTATAESGIVLRPPTTAEDVWCDYEKTGQSLGPHPVSFVRPTLRARRCHSSRDAGTFAPGTRFRYAGLVLMRQRPATASGVTFLTLEDETGTINAVVWRDVARRFWRPFREASLLAIDGVIERHDGVQHLIAERMEDFSALLKRLDARSRDFR